MRLIDADVLEEKFCELEAQALIHVGKINERDGDEFSEEWKIWSAILQERTAFKHDVFDSPTIETVEESGKWIPVSERLPKEDGWYLATYLWNGEIFVETAEWFIDDWKVYETVEILAWMPLPKPYYSMGENYGFASKEADLWMNSKPVGKEEI